MRESAATIEARVARHRLKEAQAKEADLVGEIQRAILALDDMHLSTYERETKAAAILEAAIGRTPRPWP